jgi:sarcosine oxidase subunit gamma
MANLSPKTGISIVDLTSHPRTGIKGRDLSPWIQTTGYEIGAESNRAYLQSDGILVARLSPGELLLLADPFVPSNETIVFSLEDDYQCYSVRRQDSHYWFSLAGALCSDMFAKLCSVDLSGANFPNHSIAQTSVAKTSAIIVRHDSGYTPCYHLLGDSSTSRYMWSCLVDALNEYDGAVSRAVETGHQSVVANRHVLQATPYSHDQDH